MSSASRSQRRWFQQVRSGAPLGSLPAKKAFQGEPYRHNAQHRKYSHESPRDHVHDDAVGMVEHNRTVIDQYDHEYL